MATRLNERILFIGDLGTGKTTAALKLANATGLRKCVLDDVIHPAYNHFEKINENDLAKWQGKEAVCFFNNYDSVLTTMFNHQANLVVISEDSARFIDSNLTKATYSFLINHRKSNIDVYLMFHSLQDVPPKLCRIYTKMVLFKTGDNLDDKQNKWANWQAIVEKQKRIRKNKNFNYCEIHCR